MQETLDTIIGEHQSEAIKNRIILQTLSTICDITDVSNKLMVISLITCNILRVDFIFSALHKFGYGDKFIQMNKVDSHDTPILNLKLK